MDLKKVKTEKIAQMNEIRELCAKELRKPSEDEKYMALKKEIEAINEIELEERELVVEEVVENAEEKIEVRDIFESALNTKGNVEIKFALDGNDIVAGEKELRTLQTSSQGAIIPTKIAPVIVKRIDQVAPLFSLIPKYNTQNGIAKILKEGSIGEGSFVGEYDDLNKADVSFTEVLLEQRRAGAALEFTEQLVNSTDIDLPSYSQDILFRRLGYALDRTVITGKVAQKQFEGLVNAPVSCNVETSVRDVISYDDFLDVYNSMLPELQEGAVWIMSQPIFNKISKLKDNDGNYYMLRQENLVDNKPEYKLLGSKIYISDVVNKLDGGSVINGTDGVVAYLVNFDRAYAGRIIKDVTFTITSDDTASRLKGIRTATIDMFADCKIVSPDGIKVLKNKTV